MRAVLIALAAAAAATAAQDAEPWSLGEPRFADAETAAPWTEYEGFPARIAEGGRDGSTSPLERTVALAKNLTLRFQSHGWFDLRKHDELVVSGRTFNGTQIYDVLSIARRKPLDPLPASLPAAHSRLLKPEPFKPRHAPAPTPFTLHYLNWQHNTTLTHALELSALDYDHIARAWCMVSFNHTLYEEEAEAARRRALALQPGGLAKLAKLAGKKPASSLFLELDAEEEEEAAAAVGEEEDAGLDLDALAEGVLANHHHDHEEVEVEEAAAADLHHDADQHVAAVDAGTTEEEEEDAVADARARFAAVEALLDEATGSAPPPAGKKPAAGVKHAAAKAATAATGAVKHVAATAKKAAGKVATAAGKVAKAATASAAGAGAHASAPAAVAPYRPPRAQCGDLLSIETFLLRLWGQEYVNHAAGCAGAAAADPEAGIAFVVEDPGHHMCKLLKNHPAVYQRPSTHALPGRTHRPHAAYGLDLPWGIGMLRPQAKHPRRPAAAKAAKAAGKLAAHVAPKAGSAVAKAATAGRKAAKAAATGVKAAAVVVGQGAKAAAAAAGRGAKAAVAGVAHAAQHRGVHFADADLDEAPGQDAARAAARAVKTGAAKAGSGGAVLSYGAMKKKFGMDAASAPKKPKHAQRAPAKDPTPLRLIHVRTHPEDVAKTYSHVYHTLLFECYEQGGEDAHAAAAGARGSKAGAHLQAAATKAAGAVKHAASTVAAASKAGAAKVAAAAKTVHKHAKAVVAAAAAGHHFMEVDMDVDVDVELEDEAAPAPHKTAAAAGAAAGKAALKGAAKGGKAAAAAVAKKAKALVAGHASPAVATPAGAVPLLFLKLEPRSVDRNHVAEDDRSNVDPAWVDAPKRGADGAIGAALHHAGAAAAATTKHARAALAHAGKAVNAVKAAAKGVHAAVKAAANKTAGAHPAAAAASHHRFAQLHLDEHAEAGDAVEGDDVFERRFEEEVAALEASAARFMEADDDAAPHAVVQAARKLAAAVAKSGRARQPLARLSGGTRAAFYALAAFNRTLHRAHDDGKMFTDAALARNHWFVHAAIARAPVDTHSMLKSAIAHDLGLKKMTALPWLLKQERGFRYRLGAEVFVNNATAARHWDAISHKGALVHHNVTELWTHLPTLVGMKPTCPKLLRN